MKNVDTFGSLVERSVGSVGRVWALMFLRASISCQCEGSGSAARYE